MFKFLCFNFSWKRSLTKSSFKIQHISYNTKYTCIQQNWFNPITVSKCISLLSDVDFYTHFIIYYIWLFALCNHNLVFPVQNLSTSVVGLDRFPYICMAKLTKELKEETKNIQWRWNRIYFRSDTGVYIFLPANTNKNVLKNPVHKWK